MLHLFNTTLLLSIIHILSYSFHIYSKYAISIELTVTDNYLPSEDTKITNFMASHYDCEKQHNLRQFNLLDVNQCTEASSNIHHTNVNARVYVRAKAKRVKAFKCEAHSNKERKI